ncbi:hypothetical protein ASF06_14275 [Agreia sp. Leaf244]|uniref:hypothetical protein n=1 Tax=Agreia sp. Leaf244 TaxID=1736305 RepID=UPI0006F3A8F9|nr:hypothetical protein [Agreia sp. Leaf244]KQO07727.1 hypothetical protein ASF06_14275 [Agreia sp. Leaf244]
MEVATFETSATWGLTSIVDLRNADEVGRRAGDPDSTSPVGVPVRLVPTEDQSNADFRAACLPILDSPEYWLHNVRILPELIRRALEAMAGAGPHAHPTSDRQSSWTNEEVESWLGEVETFVREFADRTETTLGQLRVDETTRAHLRSLLTQP